MTSLFDSAHFNETLFFPHEEDAPPPVGAQNLFVHVPGGRIRVRLHPDLGSRLALLLFGGNGETACEYDPFALRLADLGVRLAVADYRGYGRSTGEPTLRNALDDGEAVFQTLLERLSKPLGIMGRSLGSQCAARLATHPQLACLVWESGFLDLRAFISRRGMPEPSSFSAADLATFDPLPRLRQGRAPLLVLHAEEDQVIDPQEAFLAYGLYLGRPKALRFIAQRGHNDIGTSPQYLEAIKSFVEKL